MAKYDGLIIPRSYSEYINKTDAATHVQAHQVNGVLDAEPTENSNKAVKSGGVYDALAGKQPTLTFDNVPTENSSNPVTSDGIYDALGGRSGLTWDSAPTEDSDNPVKSGGVFDALGTKQDTLTFDNAPTENSNNPVTSDGLFRNIYIKQVETVIEWRSITSTATVYNTYNSRKLSDYKFLLIMAGTSDSIRVTSFIFTAYFLPNAPRTKLYLTGAHGIGLGSQSGIDIIYNSDTSLKISTSGSYAFDNITILGFK